MVVIDNLDVHDDLIIWGHLDQDGRGRDLFFLWWDHFFFILDFEEDCDIKDIIFYTIEGSATAGRCELW